MALLFLPLPILEASDAILNLLFHPELLVEEILRRWVDYRDSGTAILGVAPLWRAALSLIELLQLEYVVIHDHQFLAKLLNDASLRVGSRGEKNLLPDLVR